MDVILKIMGLIDLVAAIIIFFSRATAPLPQLWLIVSIALFIKALMSFAG